MANRSREEELVENLAKLLRENGERILSGASKLCLTTNSLQLLNAGFSSIQDEDFSASFEALPGSSPRVPLYHEIQFLYDFVQKTPGLKIIHNAVTLRGRVDIGGFRSLEVLAIKKTPLHLVVGLRKARNKLGTIICTRCLSLIMELFETCGGDLSSPMSWPELHSAYLYFNDITELDSSLRLLPMLQVLDLSHNNIKDPENYLEYLTELSVINLGYNTIEKVPSLSLSSKSKLRTLILRNNCLENIEGIQELTGLRELDLANNCLSHHALLEPLSPLQRIDQLIVLGNPLSYHPHHRVKTVETLHPSVVKKINLDGKLLNEFELAHVRRPIPAEVPRSLGMRHANNPAHGGTPSPNSLPRALDGASTQEESDTSRSAPGGGRRGGRRRNKASRKARRATISDLEATSSAASCEPSSYDSNKSDTLGSCYLDMKKQAEMNRQELGPGWLQTLGRQTLPANEDAGQTGEVVTGARLPVVSFCGVDGSAPRGGDGGGGGITNGTTAVCGNPAYSKAAGAVESLFVDPAPGGSVSRSLALTLSAEKHVATLNGKPVENGQPTNGEAPHSDFYHHPSAPYSDVSQLAVDKERPEVAPPSECTRVDVDSQPKHATPSGECTKNDRKKTTPPRIETKDISFSWRHDSDLEEDYGAESDPFIVNILNPDSLTVDQDHFLVTVAERYLLEKDIDGDVIHALDLRCLCSAEIVPDPRRGRSAATESLAHPVVQLALDYVKRDKQERIYIMEDAMNAECLVTLLGHHVEERARRLKTSKLQCLKCGSEFDQISDSALRTKARRPPDCKECGSDMVVLLDLEQVSRQVRTLVLPPDGAGSNASSLSAKGTPCWVDMATGKSQVDAGDRDNVARQSGRVRFDSTDSSDILILSKQPLDGAKRQPHETAEEGEAGGSAVSGKRHGSEASDIMVLGDTAPPADPPQRLDRAPPGELRMSENNNLLQVTEQGWAIKTAPKAAGSDVAMDTVPEELSPCGSLTGRTIHSMLSSVYENTVPLAPVPDTTDMGASRPMSGEDSRRDLPSDWTAGYGAEANSSPLNPFDDCRVDQTAGVNVSQSSRGQPSHNPFDSPSSTAGDFTPKNPFDDSASFQSIDDSPRDVNENGSRSETGDNVKVKVADALSEGEDEEGSRDPSLVMFSYDDLSNIDHRMKLHLSMNVVPDGEEVVMVSKCGVLPADDSDEFLGVVVVTNCSVHVCSISGPESADNIPAWLQPLQRVPLDQLRALEIGLGYQSVRMRTVSRVSSFAFLHRDEARCKRFVKFFAGILQAAAFSTDSQLESISRPSGATLRALSEHVLESPGEQDPPGRGDHAEKPELLCYSLCYLRTSTARCHGSLTGVCVALSETHVCLATENYGHVTDPVDSEDKMAAQFALRDRQNVTDLTSVELFGDAALRRQMSLHFEEESSGECCSWTLVFETKASLRQLLNMIKTTWEAQFGVDLFIRRADTSLSHQEHF